MDLHGNKLLYSQSEHLEQLEQMEFIDRLFISTTLSSRPPCHLDHNEHRVP